MKETKMIVTTKTMLNFTPAFFVGFLMIIRQTMAMEIQHKQNKNQNTYGICQQSLATIRVVSRCPRNHQEWIQRAETMECDLVQQNCTEHAEFTYHCLPNTYWNETYEVCAPRKLILLSFCAEFNVEGLRIQENYDHPCSGESTPCPDFYYSDESFKYQQCYRTIKPMKQMIDEPKNKYKIPTLYRSSSDGINNMINPMKFSAFLLILLMRVAVL